MRTREIEKFNDKMEAKLRLEESIRQSAEYQKIYVHSYEEIQKELGLTYPICFEEPEETMYR